MVRFSVWLNVAQGAIMQLFSSEFFIRGELSLGTSVPVSLLSCCWRSAFLGQSSTGIGLIKDPTKVAQRRAAGLQF